MSGTGAGEEDFSGIQVPITQQQAEADVEQARKDEIPSLRSAAEKWGQTVSTLLGLLGIAGFIKGREQIDRLPHEWGVVFGVLALLAFVAGAVAVLSAARAAQGVPKVIKGDGQCRKLAKARETLAEDTRNRLAASQLALAVALTCLGLAVAISWYVPAKNIEKSPNFLVVQDRGIYCGELQRGQDGALGLKAPPSEGTVEPTTTPLPTATAQPITNLTSVSAVEDCP
jgi:hypothetical protein